MRVRQARDDESARDAEARGDREEAAAAIETDGYYYPQKV